MNLLHPLALMVYVVAAVVFVSMVASKSSLEFRPTRCTSYCIEQARHAHFGPKHPDPAIQLMRNVSALTYISAARTLVPDNNNIVRTTRTDPSELHNLILQESKPLLKRLGISQDQFRAVVA